VPPPWLTDRRAKEHFRSIVERATYLTTADAEAVARYCEMLVAWVESDGVLSAIERLKFHKPMLEMERELGLSPSARAEMAIQPNKPEEQIKVRKRS
jgi:phage terminase small subunit